MNAVLIAWPMIQDTRPVEEYGVSHLPGAIQIAPGETPDLDKLGIPPDSTGRPHPQVHI